MATERGEIIEFCMLIAGHSEQQSGQAESTVHNTFLTISTTVTFNGTVGGPLSGGFLNWACSVKLDKDVCKHACGPGGTPEGENW